MGSFHPANFGQAALEECLLSWAICDAPRECADVVPLVLGLLGEHQWPVTASLHLLLRQLSPASSPNLQPCMQKNSFGDEQTDIEALQRELCFLQEEVMGMPPKERKAAQPRIEALKR